MVKKGTIAAVGIGTAIAVGASFLIVREATKLPSPDNGPPDTVPPLECDPGFHEENGICVLDPIPDPLPDPEVITLFNVTPQSGQAPLAVAISVNVVGTRTRVVFKFGDGTPNVVRTSGLTHLVNHNYISPGNYNGSVEVTREDGKQEIVPFSISVISPSPPPPGQSLAITSFFQSKSSGNVPFDVSISASVNEPLISARIEWGDGTVTQLGTNLSADHTYDQEGIFNGKLIVLAENGESAERSFQVNAKEDVSTPQGDIIVTEKSESTYTFFANFSGSGLSYRWNFGDGSELVNDGQSISHTYGKVGTFIVSVQAIDSQGRIGTDTVSVSVRETDLQAELGDAQILRVTNTLFDFSWKITNVTERTLGLEYTLRLFDQNGKQVDSRIINFGLEPFASITADYELPNLEPGFYNLELEVQDANTRQLVAFDSQIAEILGTSTGQAEKGSVVIQNKSLTIVDSNTVKLEFRLANNNNFVVNGDLELFPDFINPDGSRLDLVNIVRNVNLSALGTKIEVFFINPLFNFDWPINGSKFRVGIQYDRLDGFLITASSITITLT